MRREWIDGVLHIDGHPIILQTPEQMAEALGFDSIEDMDRDASMRLPKTIRLQFTAPDLPENLRSLTRRNTMATVKTRDVTLSYVCHEHGITLDQPLSDIVEAGTLICPEDGEDMELADEVTIEQEET